jgi:hypothetical protein
MSASIYYRAIKPRQGKYLSVGSGSSFIETLKRCFAGPPFILEAKDIPTLQGMAAMVKGSFIEEKPNPFETLIEEIEKKDAIEVWAEY